MDKTYSQKIAAILYVTSSIVLLPSLVGSFLAVLLLYYGIILLFSFPPFGIIIIFISLLLIFISFTGIWLLINYSLHYQGLINKQKVKFVWFSTVFYNIIIAITSVIIFYLNINQIPKNTLLVSGFCFIYSIVVSVLTVSAIETNEITDKE
jgi:hypothetical protein